MLNLWDYSQDTKPRSYSNGDDRSYELAAVFLDHEGVLEDWGCGTAFARRYFKKANYIGLDGTKSPFIHKQVDLRHYHSKADFILMRHVLEHNVEWQRVLRNAISSFQQKMALIIYTPFQSETKALQWLTVPPVPEMGFKKEDLTSEFGCDYSEVSFPSQTVYGTETLFCLLK